MRLPFEKNPYSVVYHYTAFPLGIVQAKMNKVCFEKWIASKYINSSFDYHSKMNKFNIGEDLWLTEEKILDRHYFSISKNVYFNSSINIISIIKGMMDIGYYPQGNYNEQFIPDKYAFKKNFYFHHDYLLIGYDDNNENFISIGYVNNKFQEFLIPYSNMVKAIETLEGNYIRVDFLQYNEDKKIFFDINKITDELENYIYSLGPTKDQKEKYYGFSSIKKLCEFIKSNSLENRILDLRYLRGLMEHKFFMDKRINYLHSSGLLKTTNSVFISRKVYELSKTVFLLAIKYNITQNDDLIYRIISFINQMVIQESYLLNVVDELKLYKS